jgi:hypothetical protein
MKTENSNNVVMTVDHANLMSGLRKSFTNKTTVIAELMQNARRAGASYVKFSYTVGDNQLMVVDDGSGIESYEALLSVAKSGWDSDVAKIEHPFGIGFLSALFACSRIEVVSRAGRLDAKTESILAFESQTIEPDDFVEGMTTIVLHDIKLSPAEIEVTIKHSAKGFPIPVFFNEVEQPRPHALDSKMFSFETDAIGHIAVSGLERGSVTNQIKVYLQGLPVYQDNYWHDSDTFGNVVHLNSEQFFARLPDRDKLIDEVDTVQRIRASVRGLIESKLLLLKQLSSSEVFINRYELMKTWGLLALLNDVSLLPHQTLEYVESSANTNTEYFDQFMATNSAKQVTREAVEDGLTKIMSIDDDVAEEGTAAYAFVEIKGWPVLVESALDRGHWVFNHLNRISQDNIQIEMISHAHTAAFQGEWVWVDVQFCESIQLTWQNETIEVTADSIFTGNAGTNSVLMPHQATGNSVLESVASYMDDYEFQRAVYEIDTEHFHRFLIANRCEDPVEALKQMLPKHFSGLQKLFDRAFTIKINGQGEIECIAEA